MPKFGKMGKCVVPNCDMHTDRDCGSGVRFFPIPSIRQHGPPVNKMRSERRRRAWLFIINNDDLKDEHKKTTRRICSRHFVSGKPASINDENNIDWLPSLDVGDDTRDVDHRPISQRTYTKKNAAHETTELEEPMVDVATNSALLSPKQEPTEDSVATSITGEPPNRISPTFLTIKEEPPDVVSLGSLELAMGNGSEPEDDMVTVCCDDFKRMEEELQLLRSENADLKRSYTKLRNQLTEAEVDKLELNAELADVRKRCEEHKALLEENTSLKEKVASCDIDIKKLQEELKSHGPKVAFLEYNLEKANRISLGLNSLKEDDNYVLFYTGLPNYDVLEVTLKHVRNRVTESRCVLAPWQCILLTLMRLRLSLTLQDLAYRFGISKSTACNIFERWLYYMYLYLDSFIVWPERDDIKRTMTDSFKGMFSDNVVVILHCFELFPDNSKTVGTGTQHPNARNRNTIKYFIGITPSGAISFVSHGWEARGCETQVLAESGFYKRLLLGDKLCADRGFPSNEDFGWCYAKVTAASSGGNQVEISSQEVTDSRRLSILRSLVDKISSMRRKYRILRGELPLQDTHKKSPHDVPQIDQIVRVCCALSNISESKVV